MTTLPDIHWEIAHDNQAETLTETTTEVKHTATRVRKAVIYTKPQSM